MIRISDFYSLVKTFFKNIFPFKLSFEQQFKLFITKAFEILFRVYVKKVDDRFFYSNERKDRFKSKGFIKRTVTTAFGYVTFERRKYVDKKTGVCYYIDEKIGLKRYRRLSEELIFAILFEYQHTAASFIAKTYGISNCLADIIIEAGKGTNIPYLRGGERLIREVMKEISQSRMI